MKISVALASFNGARFIREQLTSFLTQELQPTEVVICDDSSTDDTIDIIEWFAGIAPFKVIFERNEVRLGYAKNFAKAIDMASGEWVLLSDQDDVWFDNKIARLMEIIEEAPDAWLVVHDGELVNQDLMPSGQTKLGQLRNGYGPRESLTTGAFTMVSRQFLDIGLPFPDSVKSHDTWLHALASAFPRRRLVAPDCLQYVRRHESNTSEWMVNSQKAIGPFDVFMSQIRERPASAYGDRISLNTEISQRIREISERMAPQVQVSDAFLGQMERERAALLAREALVHAGPIQRRVSALAMLVRGHYSRFNGLRSFARDLLR